MPHHAIELHEFESYVTNRLHPCTTRSFLIEPLKTIAKHAYSALLLNKLFMVTVPQVHVIGMSDGLGMLAVPFYTGRTMTDINFQCRNMEDELSGFSNAVEQNH